MASQIVLAAALLGLCAIALTLRSLLKQAQQRRAAAAAGARIPPVVPGLPGLGSALALGRGGAAFLRRCRCKHGDAFSLALAGQRMTFVFAPAALQAYFSAPDSVLTFAPAVEQFTHRNFLLPPSAFAGKHATMLQALRHALVPSALQPHCRRLLEVALGRLRRWPAAGQMELVAELKGLMFEASVVTLFGPEFQGYAEEAAEQEQPQPQPHEQQRSLDGGAAPACSARAARLQDAFFAFEGGFELAASPVPHLFQPTFCAARRTLLAALRQSHRAGHFKGTVAGQLADACGLPERYVPNMLLALLWASQANAVPTIFWVLGFLLLPENSAHLRAVVAEAQQAAQEGVGSEAGGQEPAPLPTAEQLGGLVALAGDRRSRVAAAVSEALRLRCFSIDVRIAAADGVLPGGTDGSGPGIWVQQGDVVAISPYESHLDARLYCPTPSPLDAFDPGRPGMRLGGSSEQHAAVAGLGGLPGLAFGGGKYRCPGRYFAEAELSLVAALLLLLFDWRLLPREGGGGGGPAAAESAAPGDPAGLLPPPNLLKLVGVKVPSEPCWVQYQRRPATATGG